MAKTFRHILIPIDFSEPSVRALDYAIEWGRQLDAHLTLLHVIQSLSNAGIDLMPSLPAQHVKTLEAELTRQLQRYLKRVEDAGVKGALVISHGAPFNETIKTVNERDIDLIMMGSHGRTGFSHMVLGSMAEKLVRLAPCPVLVVR